MSEYILELDNVSKFFGNVIALSEINLNLRKGEIHCLLGDNGAGKSTLIKTLAGVHRPDEGEYRLDGKAIKLKSPRNALDRGIATVYQDLALVPLMSVARNFVLGREPTKKLFGLFPVLDMELAEKVSAEKLTEMGINIRQATQAVGTMSGGERQCLAIVRAIYFGARVLILDEPTAALGVKQTAKVLKLASKARKDGISVILITHNVNHAYPIGDRFTILNRGQSLGTYEKKDIPKEQLLDMMAGGADMEKMMAEIDDV